MGANTTNGYFYLPSLGASGQSELDLYNAKMQVADTQIEANRLGYSCAAYAHPDDAITAIGATEATLLVTEAETCDTNFTVPATMKVKFERGGKWTINTGITVTFNGHIDAGLWQIFAYTGTGTLAGTPIVKAICPQWFGATGDGVTDDAAAFTAMFDIGVNIYIPEGHYIIDDTSFACPSNISVVGANTGSTIIETTESDQHFLTGDVSENIYITGIQVIGQGSKEGDDIFAIHLGGAKNCIVDNVILDDFNYGVFFGGSAENCILKNSIIKNMKYKTIDSSAGYGILCNPGGGTGVKNIKVINNTFEETERHAIYMSGTAEAPCKDILITGNTIKLTSDSINSAIKLQGDGIISNNQIEIGDFAGISDPSFLHSSVFTQQIIDSNTIIVNHNNEETSYDLITLYPVDGSSYSFTNNTIIASEASVSRIDRLFNLVEAGTIDNKYYIEIKDNTVYNPIDDSPLFNHIMLAYPSNNALIVFKGNYFKNINEMIEINNFDGNTTTYEIEISDNIFFLDTGTTIRDTNDGGTIIIREVNYGDSDGTPIETAIREDVPADQLSNFALYATTVGDICYYDGTNWVRLAKGTEGQVLTMGASVPEWATP